MALEKKRNGEEKFPLKKLLNVASKLIMQHIDQFPSKAKPIPCKKVKPCTAINSTVERNKLTRAHTLLLLIVSFSLRFAFLCFALCLVFYSILFISIPHDLSTRVFHEHFNWKSCICAILSVWISLCRFIAITVESLFF